MCLTSHIDHNRFLKLEYIIDVYQYYSLNVRVNVPLFVVDSRVTGYEHFTQQTV